MLNTRKETRKLKVDLVEQARQLRLQAEDLERKVTMARGTKTEVREARVGDDGPTEELMLAVKRLLSEHPLTFQELLERTGARDNRVKGVIMRLQREGTRVVNLGMQARAIWFIPAPEIEVRRRAVRSARR